MATPSYMQTNDASLVRLVKNGAIFIRKAADNPTPPTGTSWTPSGSDGKIGYYSEDGYTLSPQPGDETTIAAHNGDDVISETAPGFWTVAFSGLEANEQNAEAYFDVEVAGDGSVTVTTAAASTRYDIVTVGLDQRDRLILTHYPNVQISAREDIVFNRTTLLAYGMTFRTFQGPAAAPYHFRSWGVVPAEGGANPPSLTSALPSGAAQGAQVTITGSGFTGVTGAAGVKFGSTNATTYTVVDPSTIVAVVPAGSAGSANIVVTHPTSGASTALPYTRGA